MLKKIFTLLFLIVLTGSTVAKDIKKEEHDKLNHHISHSDIKIDQSKVKTIKVAKKRGFFCNPKSEKIIDERVLRKMEKLASLEKVEILETLKHKKIEERVYAYAAVLFSKKHMDKKDYKIMIQKEEDWNKLISKLVIDLYYGLKLAHHGAWFNFPRWYTEAIIKEIGVKFVEYSEKVNPIYYKEKFIRDEIVELLEEIAEKDVGLKSRIEAIIEPILKDREVVAAKAAIEQEKRYVREFVNKVQGWWDWKAGWGWGSSKDPKVLDEKVLRLCEELKNNDNEYRYKVLVAMTKGPKTKVAINHLIPLLKDSEEKIRVQITSYFKKQGPLAEEAIEPLIEAFGDKSQDVRSGAAEALGSVGVKAVPLLIKLLDNEDIRYLGNAIKALGFIGEPALPLIPMKKMQGFRNHEDYRVRALILTVFKNFGENAPKKVVEAIRIALKDSDVRVRLEATRAMTLIPISEDMYKEILDLLKDEEEEVRHNAITILMKSNYDKKVVEVILEEVLRNEKSELVLRNALKACVGLDSDAKQLRKLILRFTEHKDALVSISAIYNLIILGEAEEKHIQQLVEFLKEDKDVQYYAYFAIKESGERALKYLEIILKSENKSAKSIASSLIEIINKQ